MSRLVLRYRSHPITDNQMIRNFEIGVCAPGDDTVIALMRDNDVEQVSYALRHQKLEDAIVAAIRIAQRHDYLIDEVLIVGWRT